MSIIVRKTEIGSGIPKIAVPIVENNIEGILKQAQMIADSCADIAEWRADHFESLIDSDAVADVLYQLRKILGDKLILFTCRTAAEGGRADLSAEEYRKIVMNAVAAGNADMVDLELAAGETFFDEAMTQAHSRGIFIVASYHNFNETPDADYLENKYRGMHTLGADILKIAAMPLEYEDVDRMMTVCRKIFREIGKPMLAISMGEMGRLTRCTGEVFGSCITFGTLGTASAPGQMGCDMLKTALEKVHSNLPSYH